MELSDSSCCSPNRPEGKGLSASLECSHSENLVTSNFVNIPAGEFLMGSDDSFIQLMERALVDMFGWTNFQFHNFR